MTESAGATSAPAPLKITCSSRDCPNNLHYFRSRQATMVTEQGGSGSVCVECGADLVDWARVYQRNARDVEYTFKALKFELIRHHYWHKPIDQQAVNHALRKGRVLLREALENRLGKYVGPAHPPFDRRQTPREGQVVFYAQHATAACCRVCIEEWHGIEQGRLLTTSELTYLGDLAWRYIEERMPDLPAGPTYVPPIRKPKPL